MNGRRVLISKYEILVTASIFMVVEYQSLRFIVLMRYIPTPKSSVVFSFNLNNLRIGKSELLRITIRMWILRWWFWHSLNFLIIYYVHGKYIIFPCCLLINNTIHADIANAMLNFGCCFIISKTGVINYCILVSIYDIIDILILIKYTLI